jgi:hypothetical protein
MSTGDPGLFSITGIRNMLANRKGAAIAGTTSPTSRGSQVGLYPQQAEMIDADLPSNIAPHELIHAIRVNKKLNTRSDNVEESLARVGAGQPMTSWVNRQFDTSSPAMQAQDLGRLQQMLAETYGEQQ